MADTSTKTTVSKFLEAVLTCDHDDLQTKAPTGADKLGQTADGFVLILTAPSLLFELCVRAIDGWVVTINKPKDSEVENVADYHSSHYCCYGLIVLAMCDSQLCFTYSAVAGTSRTNDARAFGRLEALQQWLADLQARGWKCTSMVVKEYSLEIVTELSLGFFNVFDLFVGCFS
jgi:hypothetical protein